MTDNYGMISAHMALFDDPNYNRPKRSWMMVKYGVETVSIRDIRVIVDFALRLRRILWDHDVLLSNESLVDTFSEEDYGKIENIIANAIAEDQREWRASNTEYLEPVLFFIDDDKEERNLDIKERFDGQLCMFVIYGAELQAMRASNDYVMAEEWCREFAVIISQTVSREDNDENRDPQIIGRISPMLHAPQIDARRNSPTYDNEVETYMNGPGNNENRMVNVDDRHIDVMNHPMAANDENSDPGYHHQQHHEANQEKRGHDERGDMEEIIMIRDLDQVTQYLERGIYHFLEDEPIALIDGWKTWRRFSRPFGEFFTDKRFLRVVVLVIEAASAENTAHVRRLLNEAFDRGYIMFVCQYCHRSLNEDIGDWFRELLTMIMDIMRIFNTSHRLGLITDSVIDSWNCYTRFLDDSNGNRYWNDAVEEKRWLAERIDINKERYNPAPLPPPQQPRIRQHPPELQIREMRNPNPNDRELPNRDPHPPRLYEAAERRSPPCDFRLVSEMPLVTDIVSPGNVYVRRAVVNQAYNDREHYLDVIFRLLREDLVSPMRDGLATYQNKEYYRHCSMAEDFDRDYTDLLVFGIAQMQGLQCRPQSGEPMRYVKIKDSDVPIAGLKLRFGQMVGVSSDRFQNNLHLATICERFDGGNTNELKLGLAFHDGGESINKRNIFSIAEPTSYLEAYIHVLKVIKEFSRYSALPFERYLVHARNSTRKPVYMRLTNEPEMDAEDRKVVEFYEALREKARVELRDLKNQLREKRRKAKLNDMDDDDDDEINDMTKRINTLDSQLNRSILPFARVINDEVLKKITIRGKEYEIAKLSDQFKPEEDVFDESQRQAIIYSLTTELALVQGPPGTGKTHIGVEIVDILTENRLRWGMVEPLLIVCYTNIALDQFLERIYSKLTSSIADGRLQHDGPIAVRLGSKSESEFLRRHRIMRQDVLADHRESADIRSTSAVSETQAAKRAVLKELGKAAHSLGQSKRRILNAGIALSVMSPKQIASFNKFQKKEKSSSGHNLKPDEALAVWLLDKSFTPDIKETPVKRKTSDDNSDFEDAFDDNLMMREEENDVDDLDPAQLRRLLRQLEEVRLEEREQSAADEEVESPYEVDIAWDAWRSMEASINRDIHIFGKVPRFGKGNSNSNSEKYDDEIVIALRNIEEAICKAKPLAAKEADEINNIESLPKQRRWELYAYWMKSYRVSQHKRVAVFIKAYKKACDDCMEAMIKLDADVFRRSLIIGATTTGAAKSRQLIEKLQCRVLIVEEAAEVLEGHILSALVPSIDHFIMIGDHQQLKPNPAVYELGRSYNLAISMFERLKDNGYPLSQLKLQHRMNENITRKIVRPYFYRELKDHASVKEYPTVDGMQHNLFFWWHQESESFSGTSYYNEHEILMIERLIEYIQQQKQYNDEQITVIATYSAQTHRLRNRLGDVFGRKTLVLDRTEIEVPNIAVETVDSFQGRENEIVIVSLVRSGSNGVGFLSVSNRICVALTRARHGMYIVGNLDFLAYKTALWRDIRDSLEVEKLEGDKLPIVCTVHQIKQKVHHPNDFHRLAPEGGCQQICGQPFNRCKHLCQRRCHGTIDHSGEQCTQRCGRTCKNPSYQHVCQKKCYEKCEECMVMTELVLPCGHTTTTPCSLIRPDIKCVQTCSIILKCGHQCDQKCGAPCTNRCIQKVRKVKNGCKHELTVQCWQKIEDIVCTARCEKLIKPCYHVCMDECGQKCSSKCRTPRMKELSCGHQREVKCFELEEKWECETMVTSTLDRCGHCVEMPCYMEGDSRGCPKRCGMLLPCGHSCDRKCGDCFRTGKHTCDDLCGKKLKCGHRCSRKCGEECGNCDADCLTECSHQKCGSGNRGLTCFGRTCKQQCAQCPRICDNSCDHRICSMKCYEVCNVRACEEPCKKTLRCGHFCLGMCSEICPTLCGTCSEAQYLQCLKYLSKEDQSQNVVQRLFMISPCGHVFPVKFLDKCVLKQKELGHRPHCPLPTCEKPIQRSLRYIRIIKKILLEASKAKESSTVNHASAVSIYNKMIVKIDKQIIDLAIQLGGGKAHKKVANVNLINDLLLKARTGLGKMLSQPNAASELPFWLGYHECLTVVMHLFIQLSKDKLPIQVMDNVYLQRISDLVFNGKIRDEVNQHVQNCMSYLKQHMESRMCGVVFPTAHWLIHKAMVAVSLGRLFVLIAKNKSYDLNEKCSKELAEAASQVLLDGAGSKYRANTVAFNNILLERILMENGWDERGIIQSFELSIW